MGILTREPDIFPENLFEVTSLDTQGRSWWAFYTRSRQEKSLMRKLLTQQIPFYGLIAPKRFKTPKGRVHTSFESLFPNYVFLFGNDEDRQKALGTNCVSRYMPVDDGRQLELDLQQFQRLIRLEVPLRLESRLKPGRRVRVRAGNFRGLEGTIVRRESEVRLLVAVDFLRQGASLLLEDFEVEPIR